MIGKTEKKLMKELQEALNRLARVHLDQSRSILREVEAEREACARIADQAEREHRERFQTGTYPSAIDRAEAAMHVAMAIRSRTRP